MAVNFMISVQFYLCQQGLFSSGKVLPFMDNFGKHYPCMKISKPTVFLCFRLGKDGPKKGLDMDVSVFHKVLFKAGNPSGTKPVNFTVKV